VLPTYFVIVAFRRHFQLQTQLKLQLQQLQQQEQQPQQQTPPLIRETYLSTVSHRASDDKYIILSVVDEPFTDMAVNLYQTSFKPFNIQNFLFVGFGAHTCVVLSAASLPCYHYADFSNTEEKASVFNSKEFMTKMIFRNRIIMETLKAGFNVLLTDLDVIFLRNPLPDIRVGLH
jgi:hypothetical protein